MRLDLLAVRWSPIAALALMVCMRIDIVAVIDFDRRALLELRPVNDDYPVVVRSHLFPFRIHIDSTMMAILFAVAVSIQSDGKGQKKKEKTEMLIGNAPSECHLHG